QEYQPEIEDQRNKIVQSERKCVHALNKTHRSAGLLQRASEVACTQLTAGLSTERGYDNHPQAARAMRARMAKSASAHQAASFFGGEIRNQSLGQGLNSLKQAMVPWRTRTCIGIRAC